MSGRKIEGSVALVTGANRGIGRAITVALLERGAKKVYATARDPQPLEALRQRYGRLKERPYTTSSFGAVLNGFETRRAPNCCPCWKSSLRSVWQSANCAEDRMSASHQERRN